VTVAKKLFLLLVALGFLVGCGSAPKTAAKHSVKRYAYYDQNKSNQNIDESDAATQDSIDDIIYAELSKRQQALLKKYSIPSSSYSLSGIKFDIPMTVNDRVRAWIDYFANGAGRKHYERWLARSTRVVPTELKMLREHNLPRDIIFLSMIESGFNTHAYSFAAASGPWQFIRSTGRLYGLESDYWLDERRDVEKSSLAAARHLGDLYGEFGDWYLAFAAYNAGAGKVRRAIEGVGSKSFWDLADSRYLRQETKDYVPKILAAAIIAKSPEKYGFRDVDFQDPIATEKVTISYPTDLNVIAECVAVDVDLIRLINPELLRNMTPPNRSQYTLNLPRGTQRIFESKYARLSQSDRLRDVTYVAHRRETLRTIAQDHGVTVASLVNANPSLGNSKSVASGTTLIIPRSYESPPSVPVALNSSSRNGNRLIDLITDHSDKEKPTKLSKKNKVAKKSDEVKETDSIEQEKTDGEMKIAWKEKDKKSPEEVASDASGLDLPKPKVSGSNSSAPSKVANTGSSETKSSEDSAKETLGPEKPKDNDEKIAEALNKVGPPSPSSFPETLPGNSEEENSGAVRVKNSGEDPLLAKSKGKSEARREILVTYKVKKGDTLTRIANQYQVSVADLREWNSISGRKGLFAGQKLTVHSSVAQKNSETSSPDRIAKKSHPKVIAYKVRKGDTIGKIAKRYDVSPSQILSFNGLTKRATLRPGLVLKIRTRQWASLDEG
jgi:membrane-bound lytic murein transglycosylase D